MDLRSGPIVSAVAGGALAARGFSLPVAAVLGMSFEVAYAGLVHYQPQWFDRPVAYRPYDFVSDMGSLLLGWGIVAMATGTPALPAGKPAR